jgi:5-methylcytosine-specific restriction protein A
MEQTPRGSGSARGYDTQWRKFRLGYLAQNPLCVSCRKQGKYKGASEIDHIKPLAAGGDKFNPHNLQGLCKSCHSKKTFKEMKHAKAKQNKARNSPKHY